MTTTTKRILNSSERDYTISIDETHIVAAGGCVLELDFPELAEIDFSEMKVKSGVLRTGTPLVMMSSGTERSFVIRNITQQFGSCDEANVGDRVSLDIEPTSWFEDLLGKPRNNGKCHMLITAGLTTKELSELVSFDPKN